MEIFTYTLRKPLELKNDKGEVIQTITELKLRELLGGDADKITAREPLPIMVQMVRAACDLPPSTTARIPLADLMAAGVAASEKGFFGDFPQTLGR